MTSNSAACSSPRRRARSSSAVRSCSLSVASKTTRFGELASAGSAHDANTANASNERQRRPPHSEGALQRSCGPPKRRALAQSASNIRAPEAQTPRSRRDDARASCVARAPARRKGRWAILPGTFRTRRARLRSRPLRCRPERRPRRELRLLRGSASALPAALGVPTAYCGHSARRPQVRPARACDAAREHVVDAASLRGVQHALKVTLSDPVRPARWSAVAGSRRSTLAALRSATGSASLAAALIRALPSDELPVALDRRSGRRDFATRDDARSVRSARQALTRLQAELLRRCAGPSPRPSRGAGRPRCDVVPSSSARRTRCQSRAPRRGRPGRTKRCPRP